jgi:hypothetical protein
LKASLDALLFSRGEEKAGVIQVFSVKAIVSIP